MNLNYKHVSEGGTFVTNFEQNMMPVYQEAVRVYAEMSKGRLPRVPPRNIVLSSIPKVPAPRDYGGSLHLIDGQGGLSDFWTIFEAVQKVLEKPTATKLTAGQMLSASEFVCKLPPCSKVVGTDVYYLNEKDKRCEPIKFDTPPATFESVVRPVMKYLADNFHPHMEIHITMSRAELTEGVQSFVTQEYVRD